MKRIPIFLKLVSMLVTVLVTSTLVFALAAPIGVRAEDDNNGLRHLVEILEQRVSALEAVLLPVDLTALEQRISDLEAASQPVGLTVNCPGDSLGEALEQVAGGTGHVTITVTGVCTEAVVITRDNITLRGAAPGDGLQAPSPDDFVLTLAGARRINLRQLTITGGRIGLHAFDEASYRAENLHVLSAADQCVATNKNATGMLVSSTLEDCPHGVRAVWGGSVRMIGGLISNSERNGVSATLSGAVSVESGAVIRNSGTGVSAENGGAIEVSNVTIENNAFGVFAYSGGHIAIFESIIQNNIKAVGAHGGSTVQLSRGTIVANNQGHGVAGRAGATLILGDVTIENNGNDGISLGGGSSASIQGGAIVRNNIGHGIALGATSSATFFDDTVQVTGNTGTAVICGPVGQLEDVALIVGEPGVISGNGSDTIECPRGFP